MKTFTNPRNELKKKLLALQGLPRSSIEVVRLLNKKERNEKRRINNM
jgi:hypothetical protein